jgi:hypothetical protein
MDDDALSASTRNRIPGSGKEKTPGLTNRTRQLGGGPVAHVKVTTEHRLGWDVRDAIDHEGRDGAMPARPSSFTGSIRGCCILPAANVISVDA